MYLLSTCSALGVWGISSFPWDGEEIVARKFSLMHTCRKNKHYKCSGAEVIGTDMKLLPLSLSATCGGVFVAVRQVQSVGIGEVIHCVILTELFI